MLNQAFPYGVGVHVMKFFFFLGRVARATLGILSSADNQSANVNCHARRRSQPHGGCPALGLGGWVLGFLSVGGCNTLDEFLIR